MVRKRKRRKKELGDLLFGIKERKLDSNQVLDAEFLSGEGAAGICIWFFEDHGFCVWGVFGDPKVVLQVGLRFFWRERCAREKSGKRFINMAMIGWNLVWEGCTVPPEAERTARRFAPETLDSFFINLSTSACLALSFSANFSFWIQGQSRR